MGEILGLGVTHYPPLIGPDQKMAGILHRTLESDRVPAAAKDPASWPEPMSNQSARPASPFTAPERDLLRRELCRHFGQDPSIADGLFLRTWRAGERRGQPKIPPAVQSMLERGLVELRTTIRGPRAGFTEAGLAALRQLVLDRRAMDPERFAHLRAELGLDARDA